MWCSALHFVCAEVFAGDVCDLIFDDAVFAASDENESLAMTRDTLKVRNGKIVIGE